MPMQEFRRKQFRFSTGDDVMQERAVRFLQWMDMLTAKEYSSFKPKLHHCEYLIIACFHLMFAPHHGILSQQMLFHDGLAA
jgi:hypothetical protein